VIAADREIDQKRFHIEEQAIQLIATQQPMARTSAVSWLRLALLSTWSAWGTTPRGSPRSC
jgi:phosphate uptake regulator